ncbi:MAG: ABC transporter ATP-binding protein [Anaerolineae bacterium]|nr:ABC transporter ATP-binding protein [Anaerolineae bacterium]
MIKTMHLTHQYGNFKAVNDLNLDVFSGELFGFLGPNGAGKSTTMKILAGLLQPTSGSALVAGYDIHKDTINAKKAVGFMPDELALYEKLTGNEFLRFIGGLYGLSDTEIKNRCKPLLDMLGLEEKKDQLIQGYSHGMRQKIGLACALLHDPKVLLLDEPLSGLDPRAARLVKDVLRAFCQQGGTVMLSTHTLEIAERMCDRIGIINHGELIAVGRMDELRAGNHGDSGSSLEDIFLQLTGGEEAVEIANSLASL